MRNNILNIRKQKGLSMDDLANIIGCNKTQIYRLEKGQDMTYSWMDKLCKALDCFITDILPDIESIIPPVNKQSIQIDINILSEAFSVLDEVVKQRKAIITTKQKAEIISELYQLALYQQMTGDAKIDPKFVSWVLNKNI
jgi:DNA-binding Xre family transcriptional regulator